MLSILNSQTKDTDQAKAESIFSILPLGDVLTRFPNLFPIRKSTANAQEELAQAQFPGIIALATTLGTILATGAVGGATGALVGNAINGQELANTQEEMAQAQFPALLAALITAAATGAVSGAVGGAINGQELANAQGPKKAIGKAVGGAIGGATGGAVGGAIDGQELANVQEEIAQAQFPAILTAILSAALGGAVSGAVGGAINGQVRTEDIDLAELISLIGNDQAIQQDDAKTQQFSDIISTLRNTAADAIPELTERAVTFLVERVSDYLENLIRGTGGEQAKMEGGLTREQLEELLEMSPFIKE